MNIRTKIALTAATVVILGYAIGGQPPPPPRTLVLDGRPAGTVKAFRYHPDERLFVIDTDQDLFDCRDGVVHADRFEAD